MSDDPLKGMKPSEFLIRQWNKNKSIEEVEAALAKHEAHVVDMKNLGIGYYSSPDIDDYRRSYCEERNYSSSPFGRS